MNLLCILQITYTYHGNHLSQCLHFVIRLFPHPFLCNLFKYKCMTVLLTNRKLKFRKVLSWDANFFIWQNKGSYFKWHKIYFVKSLFSCSKCFLKSRNFLLISSLCSAMFFRFLLEAKLAMVNTISLKQNTCEKSNKCPEICPELSGPWLHPRVLITIELFKCSPGVFFIQIHFKHT